MDARFLGEASTRLGATASRRSTMATPPRHRAAYVHSFSARACSFHSRSAVRDGGAERRALGEDWPSSPRGAAEPHAKSFDACPWSVLDGRNFLCHHKHHSFRAFEPVGPLRYRAVAAEKQPIASLLLRIVSSVKPRGRCRFPKRRKIGRKQHGRF